MNKQMNGANQYTHTSINTHTHTHTLALIHTHTYIHTHTHTQMQFLIREVATEVKNRFTFMTRDQIYIYYQGDVIFTSTVKLTH